MTLHRFAGLFLSFTAIACAGGQSGTEGEKGIRCEVLDTRPLGADESTELGTAGELAGSVAGPSTMPLIWYSHEGDGSSTDTEVTMAVLSELSSARYLTRAQAECPDNAECAACPNLIEVDAVLEFETADGAFAESVPGVLSRESEGAALFKGSFPAPELVGSYDDSTILGNYDDPEYSVQVWFSPEASGQVFLSGGDPDSDNDPHTVQTSAAIAEF